ncbi:deoxyribodipyrimidine photo-lyase [Rickettsiales bacterium]|nr:deoxyribodipyrimidine photo-lyase [Rickettsiales bacterium]
MTDSIAIHWFRQDLRLSDNPALTLAAKHDRVLLVYILDDENAGEYAMGAASRWWLHHSLQSLNASLDGVLSVYHGNPVDVLGDIADRYGVKAVYWNRCYEPWRVERDVKIKKHLKAKGIKAESANGSLLWEPWTIKKDNGDPYKVFTPFYRKGCLQAETPRELLPAPGKLRCQYDEENALGIDQLGLIPNIRWDKQLESHWDIGEKGAHARLQQFVDKGLKYYKEGRDLPAKPYVSRLSPYLHFGEISPNQLWHTVRNIGDDKHIDHFCSELGWREFSYSQLYHNPGLPTKNLQPKFDAFPWIEDEVLLGAWQKGQTGVSMVDAGMRELWQTGYMHNRVRMIVGSFLVKNLRLHWRHGERWFWDTLVDADLANNSASWQWVAGCGADAAPYFRIFNPVTQGQKFDPDGSYIRKFIPEIASLPDKYLFSPWEAPEHVLEDAGIKLDITYPRPVVDLKKSRDVALEAFKSLK